MYNEKRAEELGLERRGKLLVDKATGEKIFYVDHRGFLWISNHWQYNKEDFKTLDELRDHLLVSNNNLQIVYERLIGEVWE